MLEAPRARTLETFPGSALATLPIASNPDPAALTEAERAIFLALPAGRRQNEWWSARIAGHLALSALGHAALSILADPRGAPRLEGASAAGVHIALAHGRRVAAAFASQTGARFVCVGVDVVDPEDAARIGRLEARVLTENERALAAGDPEIRLLAWGAREAVAKATSTGMFAFAMRAIAINRVDRAQKRIEVEVTAPAADPGGHPPAPTDPTRAAMTEAGVEVAYEPLGAGGVLVFAGCSLDFARGARASAGL